MGDYGSSSGNFGRIYAAYCLRILCLRHFCFRLALGIGFIVCLAVACIHRFLRFRGLLFLVKKMKKLAIVFSATSILCGCVSQSQVYITPSYMAQRCASVGTGITGIIASGISMSNCETDYRGLGYLPIEEAGVSGVKFAKSDNPPVISSITPNSPASDAGLVAGDEIMSINGQKPENAGAALKLIFGKAGETRTFVLKSSKEPHVVALTLVPFNSLYGTKK